MKRLHSLPPVLLGTSLALSAWAAPKISVIAELDQRPGNPAVTPDGTVYFSMHPMDAPVYKLMRLDNGTAVPYPNEQISQSFAAVIGIQAAQDGTLWWLDMGNAEISPKLVGWDTLSNRIKGVHVIPKEAGVANSFHQDFCIDEKRSKAFIADMSRGGMIDTSEPAIVAVDLKTGETRRILSGHRLFQPSEKPLTAEGQVMQMQDQTGGVHPIRLGLNPIGIDPENEWVYFSSMTPGKLYRIPAAVLGDFSRSETEIEESVEVYADKPSSDGIAVGKNGTVYITNVDQSRIDIADEAGTRAWTPDGDMVWPDGLYVAPDGSVVVTINQLNRAAAFNNGKDTGEQPYQLIRISE